MQIAITNPARRSVFISVLVLILLGLSLSLITWQNLRQQRQAINHHMVLAVKSIAKGVENNLVRGITPMGFDVRVFLRRIQGIFQEQIAAGDLLFLGLFSSGGKAIVVSHENPHAELTLPPEAIAAIKEQREWHAEITFGGRAALLLLTPTTSGLSRLCLDTEGQPQPCTPPASLGLALNMDQHLVLYQDYRRNALLQFAYVLAVALFLWALTLAYMRRRDQGVRLLQLEEFQSQLLDNMPDGLVTVDKEGCISAMNRAAATILQQEESDLVGRHWAQVDLDIEPREGENHNHSKAWTTRHFKSKDLEVLSLPVRGIPGHSLVLMRDRTEIKALEKDLEEARRFATIGHLAAGLAHEIRNPLSALRGFAQFFAKRLQGEDPAERYAQTMVQEADRLNRVVTDLLFLARPRPMEPVAVSLPDMLGELMELLGQDAEQAGVTVTADLPPHDVHADPDALKQVLLNLMLNSLAAAPPEEGRIVIRSEQSANGLWIHVQDNGTGMTPEERENALDPFFTTKAQGTGLGLAIVHAIMRKHGGQVSLRPVPDGGTLVSLFFPSPRKEDMGDD